MKNNTSAKNAAKRYLREVKRNLPCSFKTKYELLARMREGLADFTEERPHATYEDIAEHFGNPTDVADAYFADLPAPQLRKALQIARVVRNVLITVIVLAMLLYSIALGWLIYDEHNDGPSYIIESIDQGRIFSELT